jgi:hypothetical protein
MDALVVAEKLLNTYKHVLRARALHVLTITADFSERFGVVLHDCSFCKQLAAKLRGGQNWFLPPPKNLYAHNRLVKHALVQLAPVGKSDRQLSACAFS